MAIVCGGGWDEGSCCDWCGDCLLSFGRGLHLHNNGCCYTFFRKGNNFITTEVALQLHTCSINFEIESYNVLIFWSFYSHTQICYYNKYINHHYHLCFKLVDIHVHVEWRHIGSFSHLNEEWRHFIRTVQPFEKNWHIYVLDFTKINESLLF